MSRLMRDLTYGVFLQCLLPLSYFSRSDGGWFALTSDDDTVCRCQLYVFFLLMCDRHLELFIPLNCLLLKNRISGNFNSLARQGRVISGEDFHVFFPLLCYLCGTFRLKLDLHM